MSDVSVLFDNRNNVLDSDSFFEFNEPSGEVQKKSGSKSAVAVKVITILLVLCMGFEFIFYKLIRPSFSAPKVSVTGAKNYSPEEIVGALKVMNVSSWFSFDVDTALSILASISGVDSVSVKKVFPDKIYIDLTEREPVALTFVQQNGHSVAMQIDKSGVIFPERSFSSSESLSVPVISGLPVEYVAEGMRIPQKFRTLIDQIYAIQKIGQKYFAAVSEICVIPKESGNYELMLIPASSRIKVLTDRTLNEDALKYMMIALDVVNSIESDVTVIDLRYGSVSYRKR